MAKLSKEEMDELIFDKGIEDESVVMGPSYGEDAAVLKIKDEFLIAHSDPISGAVDNIGWLAINIAANDIAVCGASPRWALPTLELPTGYSREKLEEMIDELHDASRKLNIEIIGGHSEMIDVIDKPLVTTTMMGITEEPVFTCGSEPGDKIIQIDEAALEGTWILASDFGEELETRGVEKSTVEKAKSLRYDISVVNHALEIKDKVSSMHDPTEGGILQGLYEMAQASENEFVINEEPELKGLTVEICEKLDLDPFNLISSGCLLATVPEEFDLDKGKVIGEVKEGETSVLFEDEKIESVEEDELLRAIKDLR